ncbi:SCP2 sterol-binding domain-containing protein [uncultured Shewanella sp.]|uniref:ubiquinone biosynthesis accessory factor UbiJ n=1 Tax=uncultured Shewanella sp. TaxID=173975 RepID=UPI0026219594|nr:SCP2 sterol-binding domain-containing protein [uncultured Shewanella sp.]
MKRELSLLLCSAIETSFKQLIAQSPEDYAKYRELHHQVIGIKLTQLPWTLYFIFADEILVLTYYEGDVATRISVDLTTLYQLKEGANLTELIKQDRLSIEGDLSVLQHFSRFIQTSKFDFAEPLSRYIGDAPTHLLTRKVKQTHQTLSNLLQKTQSHISQLATEEYRIAPHKLEYIQFSDHIENLTKELDQLNQRITHLSHKVAQIR